MEKLTINVPDEKVEIVLAYLQDQGIEVASDQRMDPANDAALIKALTDAVRQADEHPNTLTDWHDVQKEWEKEDAVK